MKKPLRIKPVITLDEKGQDKRDAIIVFMGRQGLPENAVDSFIYRIGLDLPDWTRLRDSWRNQRRIG